MDFITNRDKFFLGSISRSFFDRSYILTNMSKKYIFCLLLPTFFFLGCASQKAGLDAPEKPATHWLEDSPGVPVEHEGKLKSAVPNLYDANKNFSFDDCVYLTIQQSPVLVNSAVDIEIKKLDLTSAIWKYLPEPRMSIGVGTNITLLNTGRGDTPKNYGEPAYEIGFDAAIPNPFEAYFTHQAQKVMLDLAVTTHRKAIGEAIHDIARMYQRLEAQRQVLAIQKELIPIRKKITAYWQKLETVDGHQGVALNLAKQSEHETSLQVERTEIENLMLRTKLKIMSGVETHQKMNIDTKDADKVIDGFDGSKLAWENRWKTTEDELLLRTQVVLYDYNIMVAWAEYIPDMTFTINQDPPAGRAQPDGGEEDTFVHFNFSFPLIDWGRRYRGVQTARMQKAKAFNEQARARTQYANTWTEAQQNVNLAHTSLKIAESNLEVAKMQAQEAAINFKEGISEYPDYAGKQEALIEARISCVEAELDYKIAKLHWMFIAGVLQERYIGLPKAEVI